MDRASPNRVDARVARRPLVRLAAAAALAFALVASLAIGYVFPRGASRAPELAALEHRGAVVWFGRSAPRSIDGSRVERVDASTALGRALASADPSVAVRALHAANRRTLAIETGAVAGLSETSLVAVLGRFGIVEGMRTVELRSGLVVAETLDLPALTSAERDALSRAARMILGGTTPPRLSQFPPHLRAPIPVEVMLVLRRPNGELALWRSARASSIASGLLTTTRVAMERWNARESNLGSSLATALPGLDVEISLLVDDGTIATREPGFLDRAVDPAHGVAYDLPSSWHYLLPDSPERRAARTGSDAFRALFRDNQLRDDAFDRADLRLYRLRVVPLGRSRATR